MLNYKLKMIKSPELTYRKTFISECRQIYCMPKLNKAKLEVLTHYIVSKCGNKPNFGKTLLFKLLYFSDFDYFEQYEEYLTGETYRKIQFGPAPSHIKPILEKLVKNKLIKEVKAEYCGKHQSKYIALKEPNMESFDGKELETIDKVIGMLSNMSANQVSAYSHRDMPYMATKNKGTIDYKLVFYRDNFSSVREYCESKVQKCP